MKEVNHRSMTIKSLSDFGLACLTISPNSPLIVVLSALLNDIDSLS